MSERRGNNGVPFLKSHKITYMPNNRKFVITLWLGNERVEFWATWQQIVALIFSYKHAIEHLDHLERSSK
ncbi:MAG: hypothetical protein KDA17_07105 [Candidatus Saccharibacteria bacterium]|nr:hypothetical protein [Candidatus Saccharibacteria bacterium]